MSNGQGRTIILLLVAVILIQLATFIPDEARPLLIVPALAIAIARLGWVLLNTPTGSRRASGGRGPASFRTGGW